MTYNTRSPAVKRLMKEAQELSDSTELFYAKPLDDNLFEWHFTIRGPEDSEFSGGIYHGRILLPAEYPMKPPNILLMTPSGRFEVNRKICLSISGYHPETWRPSWSIRTALLAIIGFMPTHGVGAIGSLEYPPEERRKLAKNSVDFICPQCGVVKGILKSLTEASVEDVKEAMNLATQIMFTGDKEAEVVKVDDIKDNQEVMIKPHQATTNRPSPLLPSTMTSSWTLSQPNTISMQPPLSFEEWCSQMKPDVLVDKNQGDNCCQSQLSSIQAITSACTSENSLLQPINEGVDSTSQIPSSTEKVVEHLNDINLEISPNVLSNRSLQPNQVPDQSSLQSSFLDSSPSVTPTVLPPVQSNRVSNIDILLRRQNILIHCMAIVGSLLGLFLAVRLSNLGMGMTEN